MQVASGGAHTIRIDGTANDVQQYTMQLSVSSPCAFADCDANGMMNLDDIDCFVAAFLGSDLAGADCDGSGVLNFDDIDCFVASFLAGCP